LQIYGGYGYGSDSPIQYLFRKTRGWMIAGGSIEVQTNHIAAHVCGRQCSQRLPKQP
jgi:alkylation response protein AidB-like acyl-CoA dehydrogenase